ncbi:MAG TPA: M1 family peptidase [Verrucomicrobiales bacterium]|nr:M1 family peptidase [Verrucomicrobiales bacterium]
MLTITPKTTLILICNLLLGACPEDASNIEAPSSEKAAEIRARHLRGSITPERAWWDLQHYSLSIQFFPDKQTVKGSNVISFNTRVSGNTMQIDLQKPLLITKVVHQGRDLQFSVEGDVNWVHFEKPLAAGIEDSIEVFYERTPTPSRKPPWSGGISWLRDDLGEHFITTTCQGIGASIFWPNKDHGYDEPDRGVDIRITVPEHLVAVCNGRLKSRSNDDEAETATYYWKVTNPINNYSVNVNIGNYVHFSDKYEGKAGLLTFDYWVLKHQLEVAKKQFVEVPRTLAAFEHWFGPYPFYEDGYKLVCVPYSGMEHQSSVTYGNWFRNGYRGKDVSNTGIGFKFDFIIIHESAHEWFGNNVSCKDTADMWIHESFANYSESLFVEYHFSGKEAQDYIIGSREKIRNDEPIIPEYNENAQPPGDMYYKGGNMLHTIRQVINDDKKWRSILQGLNKTFRHQTVTTGQVENFITTQSGIDLSKVFDQYLRTNRIPMLKYRIDGNKLSYHYEDVVAKFNMPIRVMINAKEIQLRPQVTQQTLAFEEKIESIEVDRNFYIFSSRIK